MPSAPDLLRAVAHHGASDLHCRPGSRPAIRVGGELHVLEGSEPFDAEQVTALAETWLPAARLAELQRAGAVVGAHSEPDVGRFRIAAYRQRGTVGVIVRQVPDHARSLAELGLPDVTGTMVESRRGLVLVASGSGQGATSTVGAMVDMVNHRRHAHIVTVEAPIELLHHDRASFVSQLEVGIDTPSMAAGVRSTARLDADVVVASVIDGIDTARALLEVAGSGRLAIGVIHADGVIDAVGTFVDLFPLEERAVARRSFARSMVGIIAQRLLHGSDGDERVLAAEVVAATTKSTACIAEDGRLGDLPAVMTEGGYKGMQTLDQHLADLVRAGSVELEEALHHATDPEELKISLLA